MSTQDIDEVLEIIWMQRESGKSDLCVIKEEIETARLKDVIFDMKDDGLLKIENKKIAFTEIGEKKASELIRRHRLAERLLIDVMDASREGIEEPACQFEHMVSEEVTNAICTLLGHPRYCPHNLSIPVGKCCKVAEQQLESLLVPLDKIDVGEWAIVSYVLSHSNPRLHKLMSFGINPGIKIKVHQKSPTYVIQVEETQIALESDVVRDIYVRRT
ncbi:metal-dependent transcriptional regulator [Candidatus Saganbacteria bacterium]|nr:metal-dependent transcriptional regulator [Candidatus Saganbacteria bacterium]